MLRLNTTIKSLNKAESGELVIQGRASTPSVDRMKDIILSDAWAKGGIDNYRKNPILLFNHNYDEPIGKVTELNLTELGLEVEGVVFEGTKAYPLIEKGILKTFSVGFLIKDADYNKATDGLIIKDAELLEISVVSVPCNQDAVFEVSKSYSDQEFETVKRKFGKKSDEGELTPSNKEMDEDQIKELMAKTVADALEKAEAERAEREKRAAELKAAEEAIENKITATVEKTVGEKVESALKTALEANQPDTALAEAVSELRNTVTNYQEELKELKAARGGFFPDKGTNKGEWIKNPQLMNEAVEAFILSKALNRPVEEIDFGKQLLEKVNTQSSVVVSSSAYEQEVINTINRDIELELVLKPLFREIQLRSASQLLTVAPDTGYATHQTTGSTIPGTKPEGLLNNPDGSQPYELSEITFRTDKLVSKAYLANDTEEDTLIPLLPLIRDAMTRQHAKSVDQMILSAGVAGGIYPNMVSKGLLKYASTGGRTVAGPEADMPITGAHLLSARSAMGKYGINPNDLVYIVSPTVYFQLLKDEAFYNNDEVGQGTKVTGEVGRMFGTRIIVSSELEAAPADNVVGALAVNTRNFVVPRLRGYTFETEYSVDGQHTLMATTQRLGFTEIIVDAKSVAAIEFTEIS